LRFENAGAFVRLYIGKNLADAMPNLVLNSLVVPIFAQEAPPAGPSGPGLGGMLIPLLLIVGMFFLMTASQRKKQKEHQKLMDSLATGDEVLTSGGIFGTVTNVKPDRVVLKIAEGTKVELARSYVVSVQKKTAGE
jgi:preprotein translocase subunit YajC